MRFRWLVVVTAIIAIGQAYGANNHKPVVKHNGKRGTEYKVDSKATGGVAVGYYFWEDGVSADYWLDETNTSNWTNTTLLSGADDDTTSVLTGDNFTFNYFGTSYNLRKSVIRLCSNGFITIYSVIGDPAASYSADMPNENDPNNTIAPFWTDLELKDGSGNNTSIYFADSSGSTDKKAAIFYYHARHIDDPNKVYHFEIWLIEGDTIVFSYAQNDSSDYTYPSNEELGVENSDGSVSIEIDPASIDNALSSNSYYWVKFYYKTHYEQSFEDASIPEGWSIGAGSGSWTFGDETYSRLGSASAKFNSSTFTGSGTPLVTPRLDLKYAGSPYFIFYMYHTKVNPNNLDSLYVDISVDGGATWSTLTGYSRYGYYEGWEKIRINLDAYKGYSNVKVRLRPVAKSGGDIYIDAVEIYTDYTKDVDAQYAYYPEQYLLPIDGDTPDSMRLKVKNWADSLDADVRWGYHTVGGGWTDADVILGRPFPALSELDTTIEMFSTTPADIDSLRFYVVGDDQEPLGDTISWGVQTSPWARWDDETPESHTENPKIAVRFKNPYSGTNIDSVGLFVAALTKGTIDSIYIADDNSGEPGNPLNVVTNVDVSTSGWLWVALDSVLNTSNSPLWLVVVNSESLSIGVDKSHPNGFSMYYDPSNGWTPVNSGDYMLRMKINKRVAYDATITGYGIDKFVDSNVKTGYTSDYTIKPTVIVKNVGTNSLDDVEVDFSISTDGGGSWTSVSTETIGTALDPDSSASYTFSTGYDASGDADGTQYLIRFTITQVNVGGTWQADDNSSNNEYTVPDTVTKDTVHAGESASGWKWEDNIGDVYSDITVDDSWWDYVSSAPAGVEVDTLALGDYGTAKIALPFLVNFFGVNYDSVYVGANGALDFVSSQIPDENVDLSTYNETDKALVAPFWDDLTTKASVFDPPDELIYVARSADQNLPDTFAVTWYNVKIKATDEPVTFQVLLIDNEYTYTDIVFRYNGTSYTTDQADPTIGLYDNVGSGTYYAQYSYDEYPIGLYGNKWLTAPAAIFWKNPTATEVSEDDGSDVPKVFALSDIRPNPVSGRASISFAVPKDARVRIDLYDAAGRKVQTLADGRFNAGYHSVTLNTSHIANGVYFVHMKADNFRQTKRIIIMK